MHELVLGARRGRREGLAGHARRQAHRPAAQYSVCAQGRVPPATGPPSHTQHATTLPILRKTDGHGHGKAGGFDSCVRNGTAIVSMPALTSPPAHGWATCVGARHWPHGHVVMMTALRHRTASTHIGAVQAARKRRAAALPVLPIHPLDVKLQPSVCKRCAWWHVWRCVAGTAGAIAGAQYDWGESAPRPVAEWHRMPYTLRAANRST